MGSSSTKIETPNTNKEKKLKPCCACPETKKIRDTWYVFFPKKKVIFVK